jgi:hypothetical protein
LPSSSPGSKERSLNRAPGKAVGATIVTPYCPPFMQEAVSK